MSESIKQCPFCAEDINTDAIICKHCKSDLKKKIESNKNYLKRSNNKPKEGLFLQTLNLGCAIIFIFIVLIIFMTIISSFTN
jgi:uncharacterized membrane protein YvbJ